MAEKMMRKPMKGYQLPLNATERLLALRSIRGMWSGRKPDPAKELQKMREEWER